MVLNFRELDLSKAIKTQVFIAVILLTGTENRLYAQKDEQVSWSKDLQLEWADFKGISNRSTDIKAMTNSGISFGVQCIQGDLDLKVDAIFKPQLSWVKEDRSDELLNTKDCILTLQSFMPGCSFKSSPN